MRLALTIARLGPAAVIVLLVTACSSDPAVRKVKYLNSGEKYFAKGNYRAAEVEFRNAIALDPRFERAHFRLADTYIKLADYGQARRELQTSVDLNPQNAEARLKLTGMFLASREYEQAQEMAQTLLAADQSNVLARAMLGVADLHTTTCRAPFGNFVKTSRSRHNGWTATRAWRQFIYPPAGPLKRNLS